MSTLDLGPDPTAAPALRWGILAPGGIARKFASEIPANTASSVVAVGSRDAGRARAFADEYGIPTAYGSYAELVADAQVEAVYIASPHSEHLEHALLALGAGKHVLVEKSITRDAGEARTLFAAAADRGLFAMEAMWTRFLPHMIAVHGVLDSGEIGEVVSVTAEHGQDMRTLGDEHRMRNPALAGGSMLDLTVYPISFAHDILGTPEQVTAVGTLTSTGVDDTEAITLRTASGAVALLHATMRSATANAAIINGTEGRIELAGTFYAPTTVTVRPRHGEARSFAPEVTAGFAYQAAEVARRVHAGETFSPRHDPEGTIAVMATMDEARRQLGVVFPGE